MEAELRWRDKGEGSTKMAPPMLRLHRSFYSSVTDVPRAETLSKRSALFTDAICSTGKKSRNSIARALAGDVSVTVNRTLAIYKSDEPANSNAR